MIELLYNKELYNMVKSNQMNFYNNYYAKSALLNSLETLYK